MHMLKHLMGVTYKDIYSQAVRPSPLFSSQGQSQCVLKVPFCPERRELSAHVV